MGVKESGIEIIYKSGSSPIWLIDDQDSRGPGFKGPSEILYNYNNMSGSQRYNMPDWYILPID